MVQDACVKGLLHSWSLSLDGDFLTLLSKLDVESSPKVRYHRTLTYNTRACQCKVYNSSGCGAGVGEPLQELPTWCTGGQHAGADGPLHQGRDVG